MPQGWRPTHPGDPAPRWGLSSAGRLVIAITVIAGIVIALVLATARATAEPAQSPAPAATLTTAAAEADRHHFPAAEEIGATFQVDLVLLGVEPGLSQAWEGSDFGPETVRSAQMAMYMSPGEEGSRTAVLIDVVRFLSAEDALQRTRELMLGEEEVTIDSESELPGDLVVSMSFDEGDIGGSFILVVAGSDAFSVTAMVEGGQAPYSQAEAVAELLLERLEADSEGTSAAD